jgi:DNA polymerase-3 subunit alpha
LIETDRIVLVTGRIDLRGRELQIRPNQIAAPVLDGDDDDVARSADVLVVDLPATACTPSVLGKLKHLLEGSAGITPVRLRFVTSEGVQPLALGSFRVDVRGSLIDELRALLGPDAARLARDEG